MLAAGNLLGAVATAAARRRAPTARPPAAGSPYASPTPTPPSYDYSTDPLLASSTANANTDRETALHNVDARRRASLLAFGSRGLAMSTLGLGADDPFIQSIDEGADTGTGTLAKLAHAYATAQRGMDENLNKQNLFYGGFRGQKLGELAYANSQAVADATRAMQAELEGDTEAEAAAQSGYANTVNAAEQNAMGRALDSSLQYPQASSIGTTLPQLAARAPAARAPAARAAAPRRPLRPDRRPAVRR